MFSPVDGEALGSAVLRDDAAFLAGEVVRYQPIPGAAQGRC